MGIFLADGDLARQHSIEENFLGATGLTSTVSDPSVDRSSENFGFRVVCFLR